MNKNIKIILLLLLALFIISPVYSQNEPDEKIIWKMGHITESGKDFIKIDGTRYMISPDVKITGIHGDSQTYNPKHFSIVDKIMFRVSEKDAKLIIEIRILSLTS